jgi:hypothetical protein
VVSIIWSHSCLVQKTLEEIIGPIEQAIKHASRAKTLSSIPVMRGLKDEEIIRCEQLLKVRTHCLFNALPITALTVTACVYSLNFRRKLASIKMTTFQ